MNKLAKIVIRSRHLLSLAICMLLPQLPHAQELNAPTKPDSVILASEGQLWMLSFDAMGSTKKSTTKISELAFTKVALAPLPWTDLSQSELTVASNGSALILQDSNRSVFWLPLAKPADPSSKEKPRFLPCGGKASLAPNGREVLCPSASGAKLMHYQLSGKAAAKVLAHSGRRQAYFGAEGSIVLLGPSSMQAMSPRTPQKAPSMVAPHAPKGTTLVTPSGRRAVGTFQEGDIHIVYTFALDGRGTKRTLVHAAKVRAISASGAWAAVQQGVDGCAVRVRGGQNMCWRKHSILDVSSDGSLVLLNGKAEKKGYELSLGLNRGTSAKKPTPLILESKPVLAAFVSGFSISRE